MKSLLISIVVLLTVTVQAHIETGTYQGKTADGQECSMAAGEMFFDGSLHHPLTERVKVTVNGSEFTLGHPPVIDAAKSVVFFNHDVFQGVLPTATGAKALIVHMNHTPGSDGPTGFTLIENFWKTGKKETLNCENILFIGL